jgi:hypothetical protein
LRLTTVGLSSRDIEELGELARLAFQESDVTDQADRIKQRTDASPLAFAIADILQSVGSDFSGRLSLRSVMFGAVLGAYTSLGGVTEVDRSVVAIAGAIGGAVAVSTSSIVVDSIKQRFLGEYVLMED